MKALRKSVCHPSNSAHSTIYLDECVVEQEENGGKIPGPLLIPEKHLTNIAHVSYLGMAKAKLPAFQSVQVHETQLDQCIHQVVSEVYRTAMATTTVSIKPGTNPRIEYDHGNDMIARQIYSEKSRAAV